MENEWKREEKNDGGDGLASLSQQHVNDVHYCEGLVI